MVQNVPPAWVKKNLCALVWEKKRTTLPLVMPFYDTLKKRGAADLDSQKAPVPLGSTRQGWEEQLISFIPSNKTVAGHFYRAAENTFVLLVCDNGRISAAYKKINTF